MVYNSTLDSELVDFLTVANSLLGKCGITFKLRSLDDFTPDMFPLIFENVLHQDLPDLVRSPHCKEDHVHNVQQVIDSLAMDVLSIDLSHITGDAIVDGNRQHICNLLEIFAGVSEYLAIDQNQTRISHISNVTEDRADFFNDPDIITGRGMDIINNVLSDELSESSPESVRVNSSASKTDVKSATEESTRLRSSSLMSRMASPGLREYGDVGFRSSVLDNIQEESPGSSKQSKPSPPQNVQPMQEEPIPSVNSCYSPVPLMMESTSWPTTDRTSDMIAESDRIERKMRDCLRSSSDVENDEESNVASQMRVHIAPVRRAPEILSDMESSNSDSLSAHNKLDDAENSVLNKVSEHHTVPKIANEKNFDDGNERHTAVDRNSDDNPRCQSPISAPTKLTCEAGVQVSKKKKPNCKQVSKEMPEVFNRLYQPKIVTPISIKELSSSEAWTTTENKEHDAASTKRASTAAVSSSKPIASSTTRRSMSADEQSKPSLSCRHQQCIATPLRQKREGKMDMCMKSNELRNAFDNTEDFTTSADLTLSQIEAKNRIETDEEYELVRARLLQKLQHFRGIETCNGGGDRVTVTTESADTDKNLVELSGKWATVRNQLDYEVEKENLSTQRLKQNLAHTFKKVKTAEERKCAEQRARMSEVHKEIRNLHKCATTGHERSAPRSKYSHRGYIVPERVPSSSRKKRLCTPRDSSSTFDSSVSTRNTTAANIGPVSIKENEMLNFLLEEFPQMSLSKEMATKLWRKQMKQVKFLANEGVSPSGGKDSARREMEEAQRRQQLLLSIMKKEMEHAVRVRENQEKKQRDNIVKTNVREQKHASARIRRYYDEFQVRMRSRMVKKRSKEEQIFRALFDEGLEIQRNRINEIRKYCRDKRCERVEQQRNEVESMENYYRDQFALLADAVDKEKKELAVSDKAQAQALEKMKHELRSKLEQDIEMLQKQLVENDDNVYFRNLEADRLRQQLQAALFKADI